MAHRFFPVGPALCLTVLLGWIAFPNALVSQEAGSPSNADIILHNGKILTVDSNFSTQEEVAVRGNQIAAVGRNQDVLSLAGPNTLEHFHNYCRP